MWSVGDFGICITTPKHKTTRGPLYLSHTTTTTRTPNPLPKPKTRGTILAGIRSDRPTTIFIGVLQFVLPVVGWIWSMVWGYLLISRAEQYNSLF